MSLNRAKILVLRRTSGIFAVIALENEKVRGIIYFLPLQVTYGTFFCVLTYKFENGEAGALKVFFTGELREDSHLPELTESAPKLIVNLDLVTGLNSVGTRLWCRWINDASAKYTEIVIEEAPMLFVKAFSQIQGAITKKCQVVSLKVPYYSDALGENKNVTVKLGENYSYEGMIKLPEIKDSVGQAMEVDVIEESYFAFLKL